MRLFNHGVQLTLVRRLRNEVLVKLVKVVVFVVQVVENVVEVHVLLLGSDRRNFARDGRQDHCGFSDCLLLLLLGLLLLLVLLGRDILDDLVLGLG